MLVDLTGKRFGRLVVICRVYKNNTKKVYWLCKCDCGVTKSIRGDALTMGRTLSCGCRIQEKKIKHGSSRTRIYRIYDHMKQRCYNKNHKHYNSYGGRGICICAEWNNSFSNFLEWAKNNGYRDDLTLDSIDVNGNYEPSNCRWTDRLTQSNNKRDTIMLEYNGEKVPLSELARKLNVPRYVFYERYKNGWSCKRIIHTPVRR